MMKPGNIAIRPIGLFTIIIIIIVTGDANPQKSETGGAPVVYIDFPSSSSPITAEEPEDADVIMDCPAPPPPPPPVPRYRRHPITTNSFGGMEEEEEALAAPPVAATKDLGANNAAAPVVVAAAVATGNPPLLLRLPPTAAHSSPAASNGANKPQTLHAAVEHCHLPTIKCLVEKWGVDVGEKNFWGATPIVLAVFTPRLGKGCLPAISYLLDHGAKLNGSVSKGRDNLLHVAARGGNIQALSLLLDRGAGGLEARNSDGHTPLHVAVSAYDGTSDDKDNVVKYLVARGADLRTKRPNGNTLLHTVAAAAALEKKVNFLPLVEYLVQSGLINVSAVNRDKQTALELIAQEGHPLHEYLKRVEGNHSEFTTTTTVAPLDSPPRVPPEWKYVRFVELVRSGNVDAVRFRVGAGEKITTDPDDPVDNNPFHAAIQSGNVPILKILLEAGGGGAENNISYTADRVGALQMACKYNKNLGMIKYLVEEAGADVNSHSADKQQRLRTPLHACVGSAAAIRYLMTRGADLSVRDGHGSTALHLAAAQGSSLEPVQALVEAGADVNARDHLLRTPLMMTVLGGEALPRHNITRYLVEHGGGGAALINARDRDGNTLLAHVITSSSNHNHNDTLVIINLLKYLMSRGADAKTRNKEGKSLLHLAAKNKWSRSVEVFKFLVEGGGGGLDVNGKDQVWNTPLHDVAAASGGWEEGPELVNYLVEEAGADLRAENLEWKKPVDVYIGYNEDMKLALDPKK